MVANNEYFPGILVNTGARFLYQYLLKYLKDNVRYKGDFGWEAVRWKIINEYRNS
jgi:hypothetical protein